MEDKNQPLVVNLRDLNSADLLQTEIQNFELRATDRGKLTN